MIVKCVRCKMTFYEIFELAGLPHLPEVPGHQLTGEGGEKRGVERENINKQKM